MHCGRSYSAVTGNHLIFRHGYRRSESGVGPVAEYKARFSLTSSYSVHSRKRIRVALAAYYARQGRRWDRERVVREIRWRRRAGLPLSYGEVPNRLYTAAKRHLGTWHHALRTAGADPAQVDRTASWFHTRRQVIAAIRERHETGASLIASVVAGEDPSLFNAAKRLFPSSWRRALVASGFDPKEHAPDLGHWSLDRAKKWIQTTASAGRSVRHRDAPDTLRQFVGRALPGGWVRFVRSLRIEYPWAGRRPGLSR